jgi:hypothetical protein
MVLFYVLRDCLFRMIDGGEEQLDENELSFSYLMKTKVKIK